ncbi:endoribonuclease YbeY [Paramormyrops kingsleyae]|uniref:endoribonuclease YbeY n=1 Tax=Paramormyrops kingsleyae TaxID=1676925 RepID=UPI000CD5E8E4|nr:endoribonuclease YbeY [Paramormyrops kingsleyae]
MSLLIRNLQSAVPLSRACLRRDTEVLRRILGIQRFDLGLVCVDNRRIQRINRTYRSADKPTDVLSFPFYEDLQDGKLPSNLTNDDLNLGDIFLGVELIMQQCNGSPVDFQSTITIVTTHGICHLLGYKHDTEEEWIKMFQKEHHILKEFNRLTGSQLEPLTKRYIS